MVWYLCDLGVSECGAYPKIMLLMANMMINRFILWYGQAYLVPLWIQLKTNRGSVWALEHQYIKIIKYCSFSGSIGIQLHVLSNDSNVYMNI
jgi:hypothetical protein